LTEDAQEIPVHSSTAPAAPIDEAPPLPDAEERLLHPPVVGLWRIVLLLRAAGWAVAAVVLGQVAPWPIPFNTIAFGIFLLGAGLAVLWPPALYRSWAFMTRERDLYVRSGVLWRSVSVVPYSRIQHVDTRNGPLERQLGLARLVVYTAGIRGADVTIPGLSTADAEALRERLANLGGEDAV
jgi:uncharacterized protein